MTSDGLAFFVWPLVLIFVGVGLLTLHTPPSTNDYSTHAHRQLIGWIGLILPIALPGIARLRPIRELQWSELLSISSYYYTGAIALFVGALVALAAFLLTYRGYNNRYNKYDRIAALIAGTSAIGVAFFPTTAPNPSLSPPWWSETDKYIHYGSAAILFASFAFFAIYLFPSTDPERPKPTRENPLPPDKKVRNVIYYVCGALILGCMAAAWIAGRRDRSIFWPEAIALVAFSVSWLVKGKVDWTVASVGSSAWRHATTAGQFVRNLRPSKHD